MSNATSHLVRTSVPSATPPEVHITDVGRFLRCRLQWHFASPLQRNLEPRVPSKHLLLGTWVHAALEAYYAADRDGGLLAQAYRDAVERDRLALEAQEGAVPEDIRAYMDLGAEMVAHYAVWAPDYDRFEVLATERKVAVEFEGFRYTGKIDMLVRDDQGRVWVVEHKTYSRIPAATHLGLTLQPALYLYAARQDPELSSYGPLEGMLYNILHKRTPRRPEVLKSGAFSQRANIACSPQWYRHCLACADVDPAPYADFIATLDPWKLNTRHAITMTADRLGIALECFHRVVAEMLSGPAIYPADPLYTCPTCDYAPLCEMALYGLPWESLAALSYQPRGAGDGEEDPDD